MGDSSEVYEHTYDYLAIDIHKRDDGAWKASFKDASNPDPIVAETYRSAVVGLAEKVATDRGPENI